MNEIVKYHNDFSELSLRKFNSNELDLLMVFCNKLKNKGTNEINLSFEDIRKLAHYTANDNHRLAEDIRKTNKKLLELNIMLRDADNPGTTVQFVLFNKFITSEEDKTLTVSVNEPFKWILNEVVGVSGGYTSFELQQFVALKSSYAKACYRQLKRFKDTGWWLVSIEDFRKLMDIPKSYRMSDINRVVLKPIEEELNPYFKYLTVEKITESSGRGRPKVSKLKFIFEEEPRYKDIQIKEEEKDLKKTTSSYKKTGFTCPNCGKELYEKVINNEVIWCHKDGWKEDAECKMIYRSVADIEGYKESPTREDKKIYNEDVKEEHKGFFKRLFSR